MIIAIAQRQAALDQILANLNGGGMLKFYSGTRPGGLTLSGNTLLATCPLSATAFGATNSSGVATINAVTTDTNPSGSGIATFAFACKADGTPVLNMSVGLAASDIIVNATGVTAGAGSVAVSSGTAAFPGGN